MGGAGSTRWGCQSTKWAVESCRCLDLSLWVRDGTLTPGAWKSGGVTWSNPFTNNRSRIGYTLDTTEWGSGSVRLSYTFPESGESLDYEIRLATTVPNYGGLRWWFICPLSKNGWACGSRVAKLYLPPSGRYFGCRRCHNLTYASCQQSDKRVSWLKRHPSVLRSLTDGDRLSALSAGQLIFLFKALS